MDMDHPVMRVIMFLATVFWTNVAMIGLFFRWIRNCSKFSRRTIHRLPEKLDRGYNHKFIQLSSIRLHYVEAGKENAPLLLFVHGFPEYWYTWRFQLKALCDNYRVVAFDQRGYGQSEKPEGVREYAYDRLANDVRELITKLGYEKAFLVGHDWGALVSWWTALTHPEKMVILNGPYPLAFEDVVREHPKQILKSWYISFFQCPVLPEWALSTSDYGIFDEAYESAKSRGNADDEDIEASKYYFSQPGALSPPLNYYRAIVRYPIKIKREDRVQPETLIIWGKDDIALHPELATQSTKYCRDATVRYIDGATHFVQLDEPDEVTNLIREFIGTTKL